MTERQAGLRLSSARSGHDGSRPSQPEIRLTAEWVAGAMGGTARCGRTRTSRTSSSAGVSIDTRTLTPGELFVAIRGERFDGADFVGPAVDAGAAGIVVERGRRGRRLSKGHAPPGCRRHRGRRDDRGAAGAGAGSPATVGHEGRGDYRQRRQDDDEGSDSASSSRRGTASSATAGTSTTTSGCRCRSSS